MRYGILGGTFNPIHIGHLSIAAEVKNLLALEKIIFIPAKVPPLKSNPQLISSELRMKMVKAATKDLSYATVSDVEFRRDGPSYSVTTLEALQKELSVTPKDLNFIIGVDAFLDIKKWWHFDRLFELTNFVVVSRPGFEDGLRKIITIAEELGFCYNVDMGGNRCIAPQEVKRNQEDRNESSVSCSHNIPALSGVKTVEPGQVQNSPTEFSENSRSHIQEGKHNISKQGILPRMIKTLSNKSGLNLFIIEVTPVNVSSSEIRARLARNESIFGMVPSAVVQLIKEESAT